MVKSASRALLLSAICLLQGCATIPEGAESSEKDPWERYNRSVHGFNDAVDQAVLRPVAKGYRAVTPDPMERGVSNFFNNLSYPVVIVNQLLQGDFGDGLKDTGRFLLNSTVGLAGIFDPATSLGLEQNNEDFGQTLGAWGVPAGPYFVLPFLGPSTVRDTVGTYADSEANLLFDVFGEPEQYYLLALRIVDLRAQLLDIDSQLQSTYDPYAFMRNAYLQRREYLVNDGNVQQEEDYYDDIYDDLEDFEDVPAEEPADDVVIREDNAGEKENAGENVSPVPVKETEPEEKAHHQETVTATEIPAAVDSAGSPDLETDRVSNTR